MRYCVYNSGISHDSGANFVFSVKGEAFHCAEQLGKFLQDVQGYAQNTVVIDVEDNIFGYYNSGSASWNGDLHP